MARLGGPGVRGFNGATSFQTWKSTDWGGTPGAALRGFNGATSFQTWKFEREPPITGSRSASMGPRLFRRGNEVHGAIHAPIPDSFNGATSFQTWKFCIAVLWDPDLRRFNGATSFQTWKCGGGGGSPFFRYVASMGPRLFRRGNHCCVICGRKDTLASMGPRLFRRGNPRPLGRVFVPSWSLQWGHVFSDVEIFGRSSTGRTWRGRLQWGHVFSDVEI